MGYIDGLVSYLVQIAVDMVSALFYPFFGLVNIFISFLVNIWTVFADFFTALTGLFNNLLAYVHSFLSLVMPAAWVGLVALGFFVVIALRLYSFIKDISIFGFKI